MNKIQVFTFLAESFRERHNITFILIFKEFITIN